MEVHTKILQELVKVIKARELPVFYEAERDVMMGRADKAKLLTLLGPESKGSVSDKLRLLAICSMSNMAADDMNELEEALRGSCADAESDLTAGMSGIRHMRELQTFQQTPGMVYHRPCVHLGPAPSPSARSRSLTRPFYVRIAG